MTAEELAQLQPGDKLRWHPLASHRRTNRHMFPEIVTLARRKDDGTGWWCEDGSGLDDELALLTPRWERVS